MEYAGPRTTGRQRAYDHLREVVLTDPTRAGTFLNEVELARDIGVSRTPVREAFLLLAADGLVEMIPQRGAFVPPLTPRALAELFEIRAVIETHAAQVVLQQHRAPVERMQGLLARQMELDALGGAATRAFIEVDRDFHQVLVDGAGNALMSQMYATLRTRQVCAGVAALADEGRRRSALHEHQAIVDALASGDEHAAVAAVQQHLEITSDVLRSAL